MDLLDHAVQEALRPPVELEPPENVPEPPEFPFQRQLLVIPPAEQAAAGGSIEDARLRMMAEMQAYQALAQPDYMLLIKAAPGVGKTTAAVRLAEQLAAEGRRVLYAGPRHAFFQDALAIAERPAWWYEWLPRQAEDLEHGKEQTCNYVEPLNSWLNRGYDAMPGFCDRICGWDFVKNGCRWHAQRRRSEPIIFGQHQHVTLGHPLEFDVVIGDESPIGAFLHEWVIPAKWVAPSGMDPTAAMTPLIHTLASLALAGARLEGTELLDQLGGAAAVLGACEAFQLAADAIASPPRLWRAEDVERADWFHLPALVNHLAREAQAAVNGQAYLHRVIVANGNLLLLLRRPVNSHMPAHVIWLDATAEPRQYEAVFRRKVQVVDASPALAGRVYQVYDRANGKATLLDKEGKAKDGGARQLKTQIGRIASLYQRPAVITFQGLVDQVATEELPALHFYAARGTNQFESADALIVAGTPQPALEALKRSARMIFAERMAPFADHWTVQPQPYAYVDPTDGQGRAYPVAGFWADPDLQAVLWSQREAELIQAAHRVRPILRQCDIWLLTNLPLTELPPAQLLSIRELLGAPDGVDIFKWAAVLELAERLIAEKGYVTVPDLSEQLGLSRNTASKYVDILIALPGWQKAAVVTGQRGQPAKAVSRGNNAQSHIKLIN